MSLAGTLGTLVLLMPVAAGTETEAETEMMGMAVTRSAGARSGGNGHGMKKKGTRDAVMMAPQRAATAPQRMAVGRSKGRLLRRLLLMMAARWRKRRRRTIDESPKALVISVHTLGSAQHSIFVPLNSRGAEVQGTKAKALQQLQLLHEEWRMTEGGGEGYGAALGSQQQCLSTTGHRRPE